MTKNCLSCHWLGEGKYPELVNIREYAASCKYPMPSLNFTLVGLGRDHINLSTITKGSPFYHPAHAALECTTWKEQTK